MIRTALGDQTTVDVTTGAKAAGVAISTVGAAASAGLISLTPALAAAIPIAGPVIAVGALLFGLFHNSRGLEQEAETTAAVNQAEVYLRQNVAAWNASNKNLATQAAALQNFDSTWASVVKYCGQASEGDPGKRCIADRQRGGQWDWFAYYRDPIANDPQAGEVDRQAANAAAALATSDPAAVIPSIASSMDTTNLLIPGALIVLALVSFK